MLTEKDFSQNCKKNCLGCKEEPTGNVRGNTGCSGKRWCGCC
ncbi:hypothetical protein FQN60_016774 [Etheostoma spectabile]|uniref:Uncharacterized protein n=1 Tax=Etheostoma spectabile TaxID=54343 RepID=A0A5J5CEE5_9PERO|nr:hypothetical protein FQN60_016774 [Etheostoma spectabile]